MKLVWVVISILLIVSMIGMQESFAEETLKPLDNIQMLDESHMVFSGKIISKIPSRASIPNSYELNIEVIENFKLVFVETVTVYVNENVWKYCKDLEENLEYIIFIKDDTMNCHYTISLPNNSVVELREFSSQFLEWGPSKIQVSVDVIGGKLLNYYQTVESGRISLKIDMENDGQVIIVIPKTTWHLSDSHCNLKSPTIFDNGSYATFTEEILDDKRIITIDVQKGNSNLNISPAHNPSPYANAVTYGKFCFELEKNNYLSPKQQYALGFGAHQIICKNDTMSLAIKSNNKSPVCIKDESISRLLERGYISKLFNPHQSDLYKEQCESQLGTWYDTLQECTDIDLERCNQLGGSFNECAGSRHFDGSPAPYLECVKACSLGN